MPRTLVSGGTGFAGRFIVEQLLAAEHQVTVMARRAPPAGFFAASVDFVEGSLDPDRDLSAAFTGVDFFVHAAFDHVPGKYRGGEGSDPAGFVRRNLYGSMALFGMARAAGVRRVVFLSSRAVYGLQRAGTRLTEETWPNPETLYGTVKLDAEKALLKTTGKGFAPIVLRVTGIYGPAGPGRDHKWSELFADYLAGRAIAPRAGTEVHGADVAAAVQLMLEAPENEVSGEIFNVSDFVVDRRELLAIVKGATRSAHPLPPPADASAINVMSTGKLEAMGWRPGGRVLLERTVRQMVRPAVRS